MLLPNKGLSKDDVLKQIKYALEYIRTGDTIEASVLAGYYKTREIAVKSKNYNRPFNHEICQMVLKTVGENGENVPSLVLNRAFDKVPFKPPAKFIKSYRDNHAKYGFKYREFLYDIMEDQRTYPKDRLTALELLVKIDSGYFDKYKSQRSKKVMVIQDTIKKDKVNKEEVQTQA